MRFARLGPSAAPALLTLLTAFGLACGGLIASACSGSSTQGFTNGEDAGAGSGSGGGESSGFERVERRRQRLRERHRPREQRGGTRRPPRD